MDFEEQQHNLLTSAGQGDSNALVMPAKKRSAKPKVTKKEPGKFKQREKLKLSKSQKRKLKKLEDGKANSLLLAKTYETLEKYKISTDAHKLLKSSHSIGQVTLIDAILFSTPVSNVVIVVSEL
uniref:Uncharacterized protein n=1 Tax=Kalanchoe fedtschenkoi TaxID=63787 RepID=A0A7N0VMX1_KALFE